MGGEIEREVVDRFWAKVDRRGPDDCWEWTASFNGHGYGQFAINRLPRGAHRVAWMLTVDDPGDLFVLHRCDNPACCNPAHLFLGTQADNIADMDAKGRGRRTGPAPERASTRKLDPADVIEIRRLYDDGGTLQRELADRFGVTQNLISMIVRRQIWKHI